jgi:hypothetical protein
MELKERSHQMGQTDEQEPLQLKEELMVDLMDQLAVPNNKEEIG